MRSVKPGRGPSMMGGAVGIIMAVVGIGWTAGAVSMGAPGFFALFGVAFVVIAVIQAVYNFANATGKKCFSAFDITEHGEEEDPLNQYFGESNQNGTPWGTGEKSAFCPYCGEKAEADYRFCRKCGKELPR